MLKRIRTLSKLGVFIKSFSNTIKFIYTHPLNRDARTASVLRFFAWQTSQKLMPFPIVYLYTENTKLYLKKGLTSATGNLYCGLFELEELGFCLHFLRKEDLFVDVGANIGAFTILASGEVGCSTIAFEPIPNTYNNLLGNVALNNLHNKVSCLNIGLSSSKGFSFFTNTLGAENHVINTQLDNSIKIATDTLDNVLKDLHPAILKIDVEGFETEVLRGGIETLQKSSLKVVIIELNGLGERLGYSDLKIHEMFLDLGFLPYTYNPITRNLEEISKYMSNTIYIRDFDCVKNRIASAATFKIGPRMISL